MKADKTVSLLFVTLTSMIELKLLMILGFHIVCE
jgi:hypothetical protein